MWTLVNELAFKNNWVYTKNIEGDYFKIKHLNAKVGDKYIFAQASLVEGTTDVEIFDAQILEVKIVSEEIFRVKKPFIFKDRMLAFTKLKPEKFLETEIRQLITSEFLNPSNKTAFAPQPSNWKIQVEVSDIFDTNATPTPTPTTQPLAYLAFDEFTDADNTLLSTHTMNTGRGWTSSNGSIFKIVSNALRAGYTSGISRQIVTDSLKSNVLVSCDITWFNGFQNSHQGLIARYIDDNNYWFCRQIVHLNQLELIEIVNGVATFRGTVPLTTPSGTSNTLSLEAKENNFRVLLDGVEKISYTSPSNHPLLNATKCGIWTYEVSAGSAVWDNFKVIE